MKKITKILLPIASTVAVAAPMVCMTSCGHFLSKTLKGNIHEYRGDNTLELPFELSIPEDSAPVTVTIDDVVTTLEGVTLGNTTYQYKPVDAEATNVLIIIVPYPSGSEIPEGKILEVKVTLEATNGKHGMKEWKETTKLTVIHEALH